MTPIVIVLFMAGVILAIVGAGRGLAAVRTAMSPATDADEPRPDERRPDRFPVGLTVSPATRRALPAIGWSALSAYGLILASAGLLLSS